MSLRILFSTLILCLLIVPTVQAQMQGLQERNSGWDNRTVIGLPPVNDGDEGDDEGDDEGCDCPPYPAMVAKTGHTECWDADGDPIACAGTGQDGEYQAGVSVDPRFTDNGDGSVTDSLSGLIWLQNASCAVFFPGDVTGSGKRNWSDALTAANSLADGYCGLMDGSVAGDWRLPNMNELTSLIDYSQFNKALPSGHPFAGVRLSNYWSSSTYASSTSGAWGVHFSRGVTGIAGKDASIYVWPVRGPE